MGRRPIPEPGRGAKKVTKRVYHRAGRTKTYAGKAGLTDLEWEAVNHYFTSDVNFSRTEACRRAGYSHPGPQSSRVFGRPAVVAEIERRRAKLAEDFKIGPAEILNEFRKVAFYNLSDYGEVDKDGYFEVNLSDVTREQMAAIGEFVIETYHEGRGPEAREVKKIKFKPLDKLAALEKLARHLGLFNDKLALSVEGGLGAQIIEAKKRVNKGEDNDKE